jgi:hypothetical protein
LALADWEERPPDDKYFAERTAYFRQGDIFRDVPLGYPFPADAFTHSEGSRKFLSGPFEPGFGLLLSPTCSMAAQGVPGSYAHPVRVLAPVLPATRLIEAGAIKEAAIADARRYDHLVNYLYLPPITAADMPESFALLYASITVHHDYLETDEAGETRRVAQLSAAAAVHLKYKLVAFHAGERFSHADFSDETD